MKNPISHHTLLLFLVLSGLYGVQFSYARVPAAFIFGDSTLDVGTNNYLNLSKAKADFPYNGIDYYNSTSTGRFSNGLNAADQIAMFLGFQGSPPSYLSLVNNPSTLNYSNLQGVNFASGGSGILDATGTITFGEVIPMGKQIQQFALVKGNISNAIGWIASDIFISQSLFLISVGSNDLFDYYQYNRTTVSKDELMASLNSTYYGHLRDLYNMGARKFGIVSVPPIGYCPFSLVFNQTDGNISDALNDYAQTFYGVVSNLLEGMRSELCDMKYSLGDAYNLTLNAIQHPQILELSNVSAACCGSGQMNAEHPCNATANANLCPDRSSYMFWDLFHPTQKVSSAAAATFYAGDNSYVAPINISQLANI